MQPPNHSSTIRIGRGAFASAKPRSLRCSRGGRVLALPTTVENVDMIALLRAEFHSSQSESCEFQSTSPDAHSKRQRTATSSRCLAIRRETDRQLQQEEGYSRHEEIEYAPITDHKDYDRLLSESPLLQYPLFQDDFPPLLLFQLDEIRTHRSLAFFTDVDRDLRCVLDALLHYSTTYYQRLKKDAFLNASIYEEIARSNVNNIAYVGTVKLRLAMAVIQHLCARLRNRVLKQQIIDGLIVLYHYYFFYIQKRSEERIIAILREERRGIVILPLTNDDDDDSAFLQTFSIFEKGELPCYKILVPWTDCLELVREKRVFLRQGMAYLSYTQVANWAVQRWTSGFRRWIEHDQLITTPLIDNHLANISHEGTVTNAAFRNERVKVNHSYKLILMRDLFYSESSLRSSFDARRFLHPIYAQLFEHVRKNLDDSKMQSSTQSVLDTGYSKFYDYIEVMPPCVLSLYKKTVDARTHFKFEDRFFFFTWAYKVGMSMNILETMWTKMCEQDKEAVRQGKLASLLIEPTITYERHNQSNQQVNLHRCETVQKLGHCAFTCSSSSSSSSTDIEDLVQQKSCVTATYSSTPSRWYQHLKTWSPMAATRFKIKQKKN